MRQILILCLLIIASNVSAQQLAQIYDHEGDDFEFRAESIAAVGDWLYGVVSSGGANGQGFLFRMDKNGELETLFPFTSEASDPLSIVANDTVLYGITRSSSGGQGKLFKYSIQNFEIDFIHEFSSEQGGNFQIKYITDSVLWGYSPRESTEDEGSVFTIGLDGSNFTKIYNNTTDELGKHPTDICIVNDYLFITCNSGGGIPYDDGTGSTVLSGSIIRVDLDGTNYLKMVEGSSSNGTNPRSVLAIEDKLYYQFTGQGQNPGSIYGKINFDASENETIGTFTNPGRGKMILDGDILNIMTSEELHGMNIRTTSSRLLQSFSSELGRDAIAGPEKFSDSFIISVQQGGLDGGGGLLMWQNKAPEYVLSLDTVLQEGFGTARINPYLHFEDDEEIVTIEVESEPSSVAIEFNNSSVRINISEIGLGNTPATIRLTDSDLAQTSVDFTIEVNAPVELIGELNDTLIQEGFNSMELEILQYFQDRNEDDIVFRVTSSNPDIVSVSESSGILSLEELGIGSSTISIEASDEKSDPILASFVIRVNGAPQVEPLDDILVHEGFVSQEIDLTEFISDPDSDELTYEVSTSNDTAISASIAGSTLTVNEIGIGLTEISILIDDQFGGTNELQFNFDVNGLPRLVGNLEVFEASPGFGTKEIDLTNKFSDPDNDPLNYLLSVSDETRISATVDDQLVTITELATASSTVDLTVSDGRGGEITVTLLQLVLGSATIETAYYPNPATTFVQFSGQDIKKIDILKLDGSHLKSIIPRDGRVRVDFLDEGIYLLRCETKNSIEIKRLIIK